MCVCVFNSLRQSIWVFLCCQIWWFGGNFQPQIQSVPVRRSEPAAQGTKHSAFIFNDINLSTGTISGCWLRFDSMFLCFFLVLPGGHKSSHRRVINILCFPHLCTVNNQQVPGGALQFRAPETHRRALQTWKIKTKLTVGRKPQGLKTCSLLVN